MTTPEAIAEFVERWRNGDERAARWLVERYAQRLTALAGKHLSQKLGARVDSEDIVQSVFRTFFHRAARGEFRIENSVALWQLLVKITLAKVRSEARRHGAAKRDMDAETGRTMDAWLPEAIASEPGPGEAAALVDLVESLLDGLPAKVCDIFTLHLEGHSRTEIAQRLQISRQTVCRALVLIQEKATRILVTYPHD